MKNVFFIAGAISLSLFGNSASAAPKFVDTIGKELEEGLEKLAVVKKEKLLSHVLNSDTVFHIKRTVNTKHRSPQNTNSSFSEKIQPFDNGIVISTSIYMGDNAIGGARNITAPVNINGSPVHQSQFDTQDLQGKIGDSAMYTGFGLDTSNNTRHTWGFKLMAGAMISQNPNLTLVTSDELYSDSLVHLEHFSNQSKGLDEELAEFRITPVVNAGLSFKF